MADMKIESKLGGHDHVAVKKRKIDDEPSTASPAAPVLTDFEGLIVEKVIAENIRCKTATIHGKINGDDAVILLEKQPFDIKHVSKYLTKETVLKNTLKNDIYGTYEAYPPPAENALKAVIIHPATEKHIQRYSDQEQYIIRETPELYKNVTRPLLESNQLGIQWVYNILERKKEADRIIFEDTHPELGFILLPDMKWDRKNADALYLIAIVHKHGIQSLRDLDAESLPLLKNIKTSALKAIRETYGVAPDKLHAYFHYQPAYYHLHVHFTHIKLEAPGFGAERAHLLTDVIENIEQMGNYYQQKTITYVVREQEDLYKAYKNAGYFDSL